MDLDGTTWDEWAQARPKTGREDSDRGAYTAHAHIEVDGASDDPETTPSCRPLQYPSVRLRRSLKNCAFEPTSTSKSFMAFTESLVPKTSRVPLLTPLAGYSHVAGASIDAGRADRSESSPKAVPD